MLIKCIQHKWKALIPAAMGAIKAEPQMKKVTYLVYGMFKQ